MAKTRTKRGSVAVEVTEVTEVIEINVSGKADTPAVTEDSPILLKSRTPRKKAVPPKKGSTAKVVNFELRKAQIECFAKMRADMKALEKQLDEQEREIREAIKIGEIVIPEDNKIETEYGTLTWCSRENWKMNNEFIFKEIPQQSFITAAKLSKTGLTAEIGKAGFDKLIETGSVVSGETTYFFKMKVNAHEL